LPPNPRPQLNLERLAHAPIAALMLTYTLRRVIGSEAIDDAFFVCIWRPNAL
jgi:hypothetical protein